MLHVLSALLSLLSADGRLIDLRDGQSYRTVELGGLRWMAENLNFVTPKSSCYDNVEANCRKVGRLYLFSDALHACPAGWRLPSDSDWMKLEAAVGVPEAELARERGRGEGSAEKLKPGGGTGFDAAYAGYLSPHAGEGFRQEGEALALWSSTEDGADDVSPLAWHRDVNATRSRVYRSKVNVTYKLSVRCVQG